MQSNTVTLIMALVITGALGAFKALAPLEPGWTWVAAVVPILAVLATYFTVPGTKAQRDAHADAKVLPKVVS